MQYLTLVGDMGSTLPCGQCRRVLLARAAYRQSRILFLGEGTANLEERTEDAIPELIAQMAITRIIVAHRPAHIRRAQHLFHVEGRKIKAVEPALPPSEAAQ